MEVEVGQLDCNDLEQVSVFKDFKKDNNFGQNLEQVLRKAMLQNTHSLKHTLPHSYTHTFIQLKPMK